MTPWQQGQLQHVMGRHLAFFSYRAILLSFLRFFILAACLIPAVLQSPTEVEYLVAVPEAAVVPGRQRQRLLVVMLDGFRHDYLALDWATERRFLGFRKVLERGASPKYLIPDFPTLSYPNYYSFLTGQHTETHGMTGNLMYDISKKERFELGRNKESYHSHWWAGAEPLWVTAARQNRSSYLYYWPGCDVAVHGVRPTVCEPYVSPPDIESFRLAVRKGLDHLLFKQADFVGVYLELADTLGHRYGPGSRRLMEELVELDSLVGYLADSLATMGGLRDVNLLLLSDHGMTSVSRSRLIDLRDVLTHNDYEQIMTDAALTSIYPRPGKEDQVYWKLKGHHPNLTVYRRHELPERWQYKDGRYVAPITGVADLGWYILDPIRRDFPQRDGAPFEGWHGYDNSHLDMMAIFVGMGPGFQINVTSEPIHIVDLYNVMCHFLDIVPAPNSGSVERVQDLLTISLVSQPHPHAVSPAVTSHSALLSTCLTLAVTVALVSLPS